MSTLDDVYKHADDLGLIVPAFMLDGTWQRVPVDGKKKSNLDGAYCLSEFNLRDGPTVIVGMLCNHVTGREQRLTLENVEGASADEIAEARKRAREAAEAAKQSKAQLQAETAARAESIWAKLPDSGTSPYLDAKRVRAYDVRFSRGSIVVPARDADGALWSLQFIQGDGSKRFLTGGAKRGRFHYINCPEGTHSCSCIGIAEGYATGASVFAIMNAQPLLPMAMAIAFDAGNLAPVGAALRARYPDFHLVFFADHDQYNGYPQAFIRKRELNDDVMRQIERLRRLRPDVLVEVVDDDDPRLSDRDKHYNVGVAKALLAAAAVDGDVVVPCFNTEGDV